ncbi:hypothetical protein LB572_33145 [Mesorhizobium sp. BH1-1-5]|uniref:hypothetical protein n=1 Tax=Mesorhizobium sp. BH1-1-5 TaxID=2876661 RepID=UPI001CC9147C|nr:hypothetical protein [Mesorhizobium sp. BH1-1-5]MBZ9991949.1 hypothetical protein [Mesorhizobium sp. BH1-1-5]
MSLQLIASVCADYPTLMALPDKPAIFQNHCVEELDNCGKARRGFARRSLRDNKQMGSFRVPGNV